MLSLLLFSSVSCCRLSHLYSFLSVSPALPSSPINFLYLLRHSLLQRQLNKFDTDYKSWSTGVIHTHACAFAAVSHTLASHLWLSHNPHCLVFLPHFCFSPPLRLPRTFHFSLP